MAVIKRKDCITVDTEGATARELDYVITRLMEQAPQIIASVDDIGLDLSDVIGAAVRRARSRRIAPESQPSLFEAAS